MTEVEQKLIRLSKKLWRYLMPSFDLLNLTQLTLMHTECQLYKRMLIDSVLLKKTLVVAQPECFLGHCLKQKYG